MQIIDGGVLPQIVTSLSSSPYCGLPNIRDRAYLIQREGWDQGYEARVVLRCVPPFGAASLMINQTSGPGGRAFFSVQGLWTELNEWEAHCLPRGSSREEYKTLASMNEEEKVAIKAEIQQRHPNHSILSHDFAGTNISPDGDASLCYGPRTNHHSGMYVRHIGSRSGPVQCNVIIEEDQSPNSNFFPPRVHSEPGMQVLGKTPCILDDEQKVAIRARTRTHSILSHD